MALDERPDAIGEIVSQADEFISYFMTAMGAKSTTHPATERVFRTANLVATLVAMHWKAHFHRPRPSHLAPGLLPPIEVPGHASYPSGHSTQAHLFALCGKALVPAAEQLHMETVLNALAGRIARNREIAGVHYWSDSKAGQLVANLIFNRLNSNEVPLFVAARDAAIIEWQQPAP